MRLTGEPPPWAKRYVGIPFRGRGRTRLEGVDCWGLVRLVYAEQLGIHLPLLSDYEDLSDAEGMCRAVESQLGAGGDGGGVGGGGIWERPAEVRVGDVALYRIHGGRWHVGVMVARSRMLHSVLGANSAIERTDSGRWAARFAGVHRFVGRGELLVRGSPRPFSQQRIDTAVPAGLNILEVLRAAGVEPLPGLRVMVGVQEVPFEAWGRVRPKPGRLVTVAAAPEGEGGGKTAISIIASIAIIALAAYAGPALIAAGYSSAQAGLIVGVGTIGLGLAVSALVAAPGRRLSDGTDRTSPSLQGARNELRPFQPAIDVLGRYRLVPPFAAAPFTENVGDDQYIRCLFDLGYGPKEISDLRIGDTSIDDFEGVEIDVREGFADDEPCRLYPNVVVEEALQVFLEQTAGWSVRTSATDADELSIDITFPTGVASVTEEGDRENFAVGVEVEYAPAGTGAWLRVNGDAGTDGSPDDARGMDLLFRTPEVTRGGTGIVHIAGVNWGLGFAGGGGKPAYLPATAYSWTVEGWFRDPDAPEGGGEYTFGIDGSDACDLEINGRSAASWYGVHDPADGTAAPANFTGHAGAAIRLGRGWHRIRVRMESRSNSGAIAVGWRTPASGSWAAMPASVFRTAGGQGFGVPGLVASWYDTTTYTSTIVTTAARTDTIRRSLTWAVAQGQYDIRLRRVTDDNASDRVLDDVYWTALRTIRLEDPVQLPGRAKVALRIKATDQLQGIIDDFNCLVRSVAPDWDADAQDWVQRGTSNPASLVRWILQGPANARPLADDRIDLASLQAWHEACEENGWAFNAVIDTPGTVYDRIRDVAAAGRASLGLTDGKYSIVRDRPQTVPVQHFTPRNSWGFSGRKVFPDRPHGLRIRFFNELNDFQEDERIVLADGYQLGGRDAWGQLAPDLPAASRFEAMELFGVTHPDQIFAAGRYYLAVALLRPELIELSADFEHLACTRGDLVLVAHDVWGETTARGARIVALRTDTADNLLGVVLDEEVVMDAGQSYALRVRLEDGSSWLRYLVTEEGVQTELAFTGPVHPAEARPKVGDLAMFGELGRETRELIVRSIEQGEELAAKLTLVDHSPAVHLADQGAIPPFDSGVTSGPAYQRRPETPVIERIRSDDWVMIRSADGSLVPRMVITLRRPGGSRPLPTLAEVLLRPVPPPPAEPVGPWLQRPFIPILNHSISVEQVEVGATYDIRLRVLTRIGQASDWIEARHTIRGNVLPPPDVESFDVQGLADGLRRYTWDLGAIPPDIDGVLIRYVPSSSAADWDHMFHVHTGVLDPASPYEARVPGAGEYRIGIKMVDTAGNESTTPIYVVRDLGAPGFEDLIISEDAGRLGWRGTREDCEIAADRSYPRGVLEAIDDTTWDTLASVGVSTWDHWLRWNLSPRSPIRYTHTAMDLGAVMDATPGCSYGVRGTATVEFRTSVDGVTWSGWRDIDAVNGENIRARYHQWRIEVASDPSGGMPLPTITEFIPEARGILVEQFYNDMDTAGLDAPFRLGAGDFRVPIDEGRFILIRRVSLSFNGSGAGWTWQVVDRDVETGPRLQIFNPDGALADAVVDVTVRGFAGT